ncbi:uncharacterized protein LOC142242810 isoform X2 [Haematobia irritans]|uniref:uncharacterized protein LOC142242810 isoform X2 n=1 Tax=Haematobia irritans TaxID=7368 RepID=UPI003F505D2E
MKNNHEPIYSEIEDDTIHISESPNLESHTGTSVQHFTVEHSPDVLYALVNKPAKLNKIGGTSFPATKAPEIPLPLGKILHDSLKSRRLTSRKPSLSPLAEPSCGDSESYEFPSPKGCKLMQSQSMNNVRVMEHNSSPKRQNNLCKSDLSLYRSELFFENLCKTELVPAHFDNKDDKKLQKIDNRDPMPSLTSPSPIFKVNTIKDDQKCQLKQDVVSYELPAESIYGEIDSLNDSINGFNIIAHPSIDNQSTPKKPSFTTKENEGQLNVDINHEDVSKNESRLGSCYSNSSMAEDNSRSDSDYKMKSKQSKSLNILPNYKHLKKVLYRSFRRSKDLVKTRAEHFSSAFIRYNSEGCMNMRKNEVVRSCSPIESEIDLDSLFALSQSTSAAEQLTKVVNICRKLPGSEISSEMVEAERLLLFSQLRCGHHQSGLPQLFGGTPEHQQENCIFIDEMFLPIRDEFNRAIFFNYFYIVTFECKGIIRSTQSAECQNGLAVFRDCGIEFTCHSQGIEDEPPVIQCNIFMLRLRKVSGITSEPSTALIPADFDPDIM